MKVSLKKETNIIDVPDEGAVRLIETTKDGYFRYEVSYRVDPQRAIQNDAITVKILASQKPFSKQPTSLLTQFNPELLIKNIQKKASINKDQSKSQKSNIIFTYISDISSKIPNNKTTELAIGNVLGKGNVILNKQKIIKTQTVQEINEQNITLPVLENNLANTVVQTQIPRNTAIARKDFVNILIRKGIDPAKISGTKINTIQSAKKVADGVVSSPAQSLKKYNLTESQKISFFGNLINDINPNSVLQLNSLDHVNVLVDSPRTTIDIIETVDIPIGLLQLDTFFFILQLIDKNGIEIQSINISVPHSKNISNLEIPVHPPKLVVLQTGIPGKNIIQVKQVDKNATGVALYRKEIKTGIPITDSSYTFIGDISITSDQDFQRIEDFVNNYNTVIYRAIPFNSSRMMSSEFDTAGVQGIKRRKSEKYDKRQNFVSIVGEIVNGAISLEIRDIPPGVCLVSLLRRNLTIREKNFSVIVKPFLITNEEYGAPLFATDNNVQENRIYEYQVELLYPDGNKDIGANNLIIKYEPITANIVETTVSKPNVIQSGVDLDVQFELNSSLTSTDLDYIQKTLKNQGLLDYYQDGILSEKEKLQSIIAYGIKRANLTTGELEDFGIVADTNFSDKKYGPVKSVKPLQAGNEYRYFITTYFRKTETTLENVERTVQVSQNIFYTFKPSKWLHPLTLKNGNITTEASRKKNHSQTAFSFGAVGSIATVNVSLADVLPSVVEASAQKFGKNSNIIRWRVQGQVTKIDHFIIILEMIGMRTVVGKCHNISESNYFQFIDVLENGEKGKLTYYIVPVFYDFVRGTEVSTNEVIV